MNKTERQVLLIGKRIYINLINNNNDIVGRWRKSQIYCIMCCVIWHFEAITAITHTTNQAQIANDDSV